MCSSDYFRDANSYQGSGGMGLLGYCPCISMCSPGSEQKCRLEPGTERDSMPGFAKHLESLELPLMCSVCFCEGFCIKQRLKGGTMHFFSPCCENGKHFLIVRVPTFPAIGLALIQCNFGVLEAFEADCTPISSTIQAVP